jgi:beta-galactosidase
MNIMMIRNFLLYLLCLTASVHSAQDNRARVVLNINKDWKFVKQEKFTNQLKWTNIHLPHTWNVADVMDDSPGYYRGVGWYRKQLDLRKFKGKKINLYFEGANQEAEVFINGKKAGEHIGGYSGFNISLDDHAKFDGKDEVLVKVNNRYNENIPPLSADFTFFGGIYRDVFLTVTDKIHFSNEYGAPGVYISTPSVSKEAASVRIKSLVVNETDVAKKIRVITIIRDRNKIIVAETISERMIEAAASDSIIQNINSIQQPKLWSPETPYLYTAETRIIGDKGTVLDDIKNSVGFRWFSFDAEKGFFLNGESYKLVGASRHQDREGKGNAVSNEEAINDLVLLKKMGGNFLRVAHYPQDPIVLKACDSLGLLGSVEIPIVNEITQSDSFYNNCEQMQLEMIKQNYNHPSVIMWCYMNEVLLRPHFSNDKEKQKQYFSDIKTLAQRLEDLTRKEDPSRYTMMANHGSFTQYKNAGLLEIPMIVGWNLYSGWYGGKMQDFPVFLDDFHKAYPNTPVIVSEYGSDADPRIRSNTPIRFDKSIEYTTKFHQYYLTEMLKRPFVAAAAVWNLADFNSETRAETMPHINNKGLLKWDRSPKDGYFYYKAMLSKQPYIKILGDQKRFGINDSASKTSLQLIQIATNTKNVTLYVDGKKYLANAENGLAELNVFFKEGLNKVTAETDEDRNVKTEMNITFISQPYFSTDINFDHANILLGAQRSFIDDKGNWWQPDENYKTGRFGSIGGAAYKQPNNNRLPYGTDKNILGTDNDPIYQTQRSGIKQYRFDVLPGKYKLTLHFSELAGGEISALPYNLSNESGTEKLKRRVFNLAVNGKNFLQNFNIAQQYGSATAVNKTIKVVVNNDRVIVIDFIPVEGDPVLNAIQIQKIKR